MLYIKYPCDADQVPIEVPIETLAVGFGHLHLTDEKIASEVMWLAQVIPEQELVYKPSWTLESLFFLIIIFVALLAGIECQNIAPLIPIKNPEPTAPDGL